MRRSLPLWALLLQACDKPPVPPPPANLGPPQGILRLDRSGTAAWDLVKDANPGFPSLAFKLSYYGPKSRLEVRHEGWHKGKTVGSGKGNHLIQLPLVDDAAFGFSDGTAPDGRSVAVVHTSLPAESKKPGGAGGSRLGDTQQYAVPPLKMRSKRTYEPAWPLEIQDGQEAILWAVFVDEPADLPAGASVEERAKRADTAWIFRIRTADEPK